MAFEDVLVPTDFGTGSRVALERALDSLGPDGGRIIVLHVIDQRLLEHVRALYPEMPEEAGLSRLQEQAREAATQLMAGMQTARVDIEPLIVEGVPFLKIVQLARDLDVDLIVMALHRGPAHFEQVLFGSTAERVMRIAPCPVLIVPETTVLHEEYAATGTAG
jgi:nucleotide-binding universal stress UspA family protein